MAATPLKSGAGSTRPHAERSSPACWEPLTHTADT